MVPIECADCGSGVYVCRKWFLGLENRFFVINSARKPGGYSTRRRIQYEFCCLKIYDKKLFSKSKNHIQQAQTPDPQSAHSICTVHRVWPTSKQLVELSTYGINRFFGTKNSFPEKINPTTIVRIVALYRMATFAEIGGKKFSSFPRGDLRETQKLTPRYWALYWPPGGNYNMGAFWLRGESVLKISCKSVELISSCGRMVFCYKFL